MSVSRSTLDADEVVTDDSGNKSKVTGGDFVNDFFLANLTSGEMGIQDNQGIVVEIDVDEGKMSPGMANRYILAFPTMRSTVHM